MTDADDYEKAAKELLRVAPTGVSPSSWQNGLVKAVSGLGWAVLAHMKREEERYKVVAVEDPLRDFIENFDEDTGPRRRREGTQ